MAASRYDEMMKAKKFLPFRMERLTEQMVERAAEELNETDETRGPALEEMRKLLKKETKLKCPTEDAYLLQFLRARKFDVKRAFALLQNKYKVKKAYGDVYDSCKIEDLVKLFDLNAATCLPYRDADGCVILLFKMGNWNPDEHKIVDALCGMTFLILMCIEDVATQVTGVRVIMDVKGASLRQVRCLTPRYIQLFSKALRNCLPCRFKGIHIYNESTIFQYIWSILKLFLTEKINKRVHFHGDNQKHLHKFIPKAILPAEYGGDNLSFDFSEWCKKEVPTYFERFQVILDSGYQS